MALKPTTKSKTAATAAPAIAPAEAPATEKPTPKTTAKLPPKAPAKKPTPPSDIGKKRLERAQAAAEKAHERHDKASPDILAAADRALEGDDVAVTPVHDAVATDTHLQSAAVPAAPKPKPPKETAPDPSKLSWDDVQQKIRERQAARAPAPKMDWSAFLKK